MDTVVNPVDGLCIWMLHFVLLTSACQEQATAQVKKEEQAVGDREVQLSQRTGECWTTGNSSRTISGHH